MSTVVDNRRGRAPRSSAAQTRARVLAAARLAFSRAGFDHVGMRELAQAAATDAAVIIRLFGSKEALFAEVAGGAFDLEAAFQGSMEGLGERVAMLLTGPIGLGGEEDFDAFQFLLRSAASPVAAPILSRSLHADFVRPLAQRMAGPEAEARAAMIAAYVVGFATLRVSLGSPSLETAPRPVVVALLGGAIQACVGR